MEPDQLDSLTSELQMDASKALINLAERVQKHRLGDRQSVSFNLKDLGSASFLAEFDARIAGLPENLGPVLYAFVPRRASVYARLKVAYDAKPTSRPKDDGIVDTNAPNHSRRKKGKNPNFTYASLNGVLNRKSLYVGSGASELHRRISTHTGQTDWNGTYAMRLNLWASKIDGEIDLHIWSLPDSKERLEREALEQALWDKLRPMLGKRSGK